ncbi:MAG TPA: acetate kinase [Chthonomonadaceae bacterium]|nr:acetate kinase [Chthonomonadaceae bacterium]
MNILVLNAGSATLKFGVFRMAENGAGETLAEGLIEGVNTPEATLRLTPAGQPETRRSIEAATPIQAAEQAIRACSDLKIEAAGYRVVHGGSRFVAPTRVTPEILEEVRKLDPLAPLHNPVDRVGIETGLCLLPKVPAVAVFDTAFHASLPEVARTYALPWQLSERSGLRRYGFHGISHRYVSGQLLERLGRDPAGTRLITCHLGNGASLCALRDGKSVETSMGLTPLEGLVMGTRSGDVDPGLLLYLLREGGMTAAELEDVLDHQSGLRGLSGRSSDLRTLEQAAAEGDARAALAMEVFAYRVRKYLGAYAAVLGGLDAVTFTGGIGEHSAAMRQRICEGLEFLGLRLDAPRNAAAIPPNAAPISSEDSAVSVWMIPTNEELQIARETFRLLQGQGP